MLVPSASRKDAARVASILSIVRDLSVARPANIRACVFLDMAVNKFECVFFVGSPSSLSYSTADGQKRCTEVPKIQYLYCTTLVRELKANAREWVVYQDGTTCTSAYKRYT